MNIFKKIFKPRIKTFSHQYISMVAHLSPFGKIIKDFDNMVITLQTSNGEASAELRPLYEKWLEVPKEEKESVLLSMASELLSNANSW